VSKLQTETGVAILGTLETLSGRAEIADTEITRNPDGTFEFEYQGSTEVFWDDQRTVVRNGQRIFLDENGAEWPEDQLELVEEDPNA